MEAEQNATAALTRLEAILAGCGSVCVGYSGGVDSALLAVMAVRVLGAERVLAVTGLSPSYPQVQLRMARQIARDFGVPHLEVPTSELDDPNYAANPVNRCYFCKSELWPRITEVARERGFATVLDGSNADDSRDYRPGFAAAREHGVRAPLMEAGLDKQTIRRISHEFGLPTWDQPAAPCLSSRLPYGVAVTPERLAQVEAAEEALRALGFREFRVRHHADAARIEFAPSELRQATSHASTIHRSLSALGFGSVLLDVEGYRRGALNEVLVQLSGPPAESSETAPSCRSAGYHGDIAVVDATDLDDARAAATSLRAAGFRYIALDLGTLS